MNKKSLKSYQKWCFNNIYPFYFLITFWLFLFLGPVLYTPNLSSGAAVGQELNLGTEAELIEHGFIYAADEGMMKTWWIFSFQNKVYRFEEAKFVDDLSNEKDMGSFNQSKAKEVFKND